MKDEIKDGQVDELDEIFKEFSEANPPEKKEPEKEEDKQEPDELDLLLDESLKDEEPGKEPEKKDGVFSDDDVKKQLEEIKKQNADLTSKLSTVETDFSKTKEEQTAIHENNTKIALIDKELIELDSNAGKLNNYRTTLEKALENQEITAQQYTAEISKVTALGIQMQAKAQELINKKQSIPSVDQYQQIQQVKQKNNEFYNKFSENVKDDLVKKNLEKLKREKYDPFGVPLEQSTDWNDNAQWIESIVKEAEQRGYQKAVERIAERKAKGKLNVSSGGAKGSSVKEVSVSSADEALKLNDADFAKYIEDI